MCPNIPAGGTVRATRSGRVWALALALNGPAFFVDVIERQRMALGLDRAVRAAIDHQIGGVVGAIDACIFCIFVFDDCAHSGGSYLG